jgi:hypothetical protein
MNAPPDSLTCKARLRPRVRRNEPGREAFTPQLTPREVGTITSVSTGIARVSGLPGVGLTNW